MKVMCWAGVFVCLLSQGTPRTSYGQDHIKISGLAYLDYYYTLNTPEGEDENANGFDYRRLYLTTDFSLPGDFSGRARLEASSSSTTSEGRPAPFVKDLYVRWRNAIAQGHDLTLGISSPPAFGISEGFWGFRSLEKTILDRNKILSSRDFGLTLSGRFDDDGVVRYAVMLANNNSVSGEEDKHKRLYGQLQLFPSDAFTVTLSGDYASYNDERDDGYGAAIFAGYRADAFRIGVEGFVNVIDLTDETDTNTLAGGTVFLIVPLTGSVEAVLRADRLERDLAGATSNETFLLGGIAFSPNGNVHIIPNLGFSNDSVDDEALLTGRLTVHVDF